MSAEEEKALGIKTFFSERYPQILNMYRRLAGESASSIGKVLVEWDTVTHICQHLMDVNFTVKDLRLVVAQSVAPEVFTIQY